MESGESRMEANVNTRLRDDRAFDADRRGESRMRATRAMFLWATVLSMPTGVGCNRILGNDEDLVLPSRGVAGGGIGGAAMADAAAGATGDGIGGAAMADGAAGATGAGGARNGAGGASAGGAGGVDAGPSAQ